jgi:hypothetical protein
VGVGVSIASMRLRQRAPASSICSIIGSRSLSDRESRANCQPTTPSSGRRGPASDAAPGGPGARLRRVRRLRGPADPGPRLLTRVHTRRASLSPCRNVLPLHRIVQQGCARHHPHGANVSKKLCLQGLWSRKSVAAG